MNTELTTKKQIKQLSLKKPGDIKNYQSGINEFNRFLKLKNLAVNPESIMLYYEERARTKAPRTLAHDKSAIKAAMRASMGAGITVDELMKFDYFFKQIKPPKVSSGIKTYLEVSELRKLVAVSGPKTGLIIRALFCTAARVSEVMGIRLADCREFKGEIVIDLHRPKTNRIDTVYMKPDLFSAIKAAYPGETYLFEKNGQPLSRHTVHALLKAAGKKIGRPDIHAHLARHSWASYALGNGMDVAEVSAYLGHSRMDTTTRFYLHRSPSMEKVSAVNALAFAV